MKEPTSEPEIATTLPAPPARRLEAIVCGWNPPAASDGVPDADHRRRLIESACAAGIEVAIVTSARLDEADGRLGARPRGPGRLLLVPERGAAIFRVDQDGPQPVRRGPITADDETELSQKLGLADKSGSLRRVMIELWLSGIGPSQVLAVSDEFGAAGWAAVLENQIEHRLRGELPLVSEDPEWTLAVADGEAGGERARESLLALADGRLGTGAAGS
jgi:hypothetical protein